MDTLDNIFWFCTILPSEERFLIVHKSFKCLLLILTFITCVVIFFTFLAARKNEGINQTHISHFLRRQRHGNLQNNFCEVTYGWALWLRTLSGLVYFQFMLAATTWCNNTHKFLHTSFFFYIYLCAEKTNDF